MEGGKEEVAKKGFVLGFKCGLKASVRWSRLNGRLRYVLYNILNSTYVCSEHHAVL